MKTTVILLFAFATIFASPSARAEPKAAQSQSQTQSPKQSPNQSPTPTPQLPACNQQKICGYTVGTVANPSQYFLNCHAILAFVSQHPGRSLIVSVPPSPPNPGLHYPASQVVAWAASCRPPIPTQPNPESGLLPGARVEGFRSSGLTGYASGAESPSFVAGD